MSLVGFSARNHPQQVAKASVDDRGTTWEVFWPLHKRFRFTLDAAASAENTKCLRYFTAEDDGLARSWAGERVWCNPPYSKIEPWVEKAGSSGAELVVMLLPANRTEQGFWQRWIEPFRDGRGDKTLEIPLSNSENHAVIDEIDADLVRGFKWRLESNGYVVSSLPRLEGKNRKQYLHRLVMGLEPNDGIKCDHDNRNRLDNRRSNLRSATSAQNGCNRSLYANNSSGFKGVSFDKRSSKWEASIKIDYCKKFLGYFDSPEEAAVAYDEAAMRIHGLFASPNESDVQRHIEHVRDRPGGPRVEFLSGRMRFIVPPSDVVKPNDRPPFGCCLVIWGA